MKKQAILVVSFGTSFKEIRERTIDAFEQKLTGYFPDYEIRRAFTSDMIIEILKKRDGIHTPTVKEALEQLISEGYEKVILQPTHIICGTENTKMKEAAEQYRNYFSSLSIGTPLLTSTSDMEATLQAIASEFSYLPKDTALVCMGHGTEHCCNPVYTGLDYMFKEKGFQHIFVGTVEAYPLLPTLIPQLKQYGSPNITLMPLMFVAGDHAINDMSSPNKNSWKSTLEQEGFKVSCSLKGLGEYESIQNIYIDHLKKALTETA